MKKTLLASLGCMAAALAATAQVTHWIGQPDYDALRISADGKYIVSDSAGKSQLATLDGRLIYSTPDIISPFQEGLAVIVGRDSKEITGFIDESGKFTALDGGKVTYNYPYFSEGLLLFEKDGDYGYYKTDGTQAKTNKVERAYPMHNGYAPQYGYAQSLLKIKKVPCFYYANEGGSQMSFFLNDDMVADKDVIFASGIPETGKSVVIIKNKLYWFDTASTELEPMCHGEGADADVQMTIDKNQMGYFGKLPAGPVQFVANYGKNKTATLSFDDQLQPVKIIYEDETFTFPAPAAAAAPSLESDLSKDGTSAPYGLAYKGNKIIEPQFQDVAATYGNRAIVKIGGKWGIMEVIATPKLEIALNRGREIPFRHQTVETDLCVKLPATFPASGLKVSADSVNGYIIDVASRTEKSTPGANYVFYDCTLHMPDGLTNTLTDLTYPIMMTYDGADLPADTINAKAWHVVYYTVDPIEIGNKAENGTVTFAFDVEKHMAANEQDYPFDVTVNIGQASLAPVKVSENRYKVDIPGIAPGVYHVDINVIEEGCPAMVFPFDLAFEAADADKDAVIELTMADKVEPMQVVIQQYAQMPAMQYAQPMQQQYVQQMPMQEQYTQPVPQQQYAQPVQQQYTQPVQQQYAQPVQQQYAQPVQQQYAQPVQQQYAQPTQQQYTQPVQQTLQPVQQQYAQPVQQQYVQPVQQQYTQPVQQTVQPVQQQVAQQQYAQPIYQ